MWVDDETLVSLFTLSKTGWTENDVPPWLVAWQRIGPLPAEFVVPHYYFGPSLDFLRNLLLIHA